MTIKFLKRLLALEPFQSVRPHAFSISQDAEEQRLLREVRLRLKRVAREIDTLAETLTPREINRDLH